MSRRETSHSGLPCGFYRQPKSINVRYDKDSTWLDRDGIGFVEIARSHEGHEMEYDLPVGTPIIVINTAKGNALREGDWDGYETVLVPGEDRGSWRVCWSVARRLIDAHPGRVAIIADGEWNFFDEIFLSPFHEKSWGTKAPSLAHVSTSAKVEPSPWRPAPVQWQLEEVSGFTPGLSLETFCYVITRAEQRTKALPAPGESLCLKGGVR